MAAGESHGSNQVHWMAARCSLSWEWYAQ